jgi:hypothetical protein
MDITRLTGVSRSEDIRQEDFRMVVEFLEEQVRALARSTLSPRRPLSAPQVS